MDLALVRRLTMVSTRHDWVMMAVSSAYSANRVWGGCGISEIYSANRVVDRTAPWGKPEGVVMGRDMASLR